MGQNGNGLDWFMNVFKKMEDRCLEMCDVLEKEVLKYVEGQPKPVVGIDEEYSQEAHLDIEEDQSPEKTHDANQNASSVGTLGKVPGVHHHQTQQGTPESSYKQNYCTIEPNHFSANQGVREALKIEKEKAKANIPRSSRKQSQKANALIEELVKFPPSTVQNDEFPDWEII